MTEKEKDEVFAEFEDVWDEREAILKAQHRREMVAYRKRTAHDSKIIHEQEAEIEQLKDEEERLRYYLDLIIDETSGQPAGTTLNKICNIAIRGLVGTRLKGDNK
jgi:hypothetical protein